MFRGPKLLQQDKIQQHNLEGLVPAVCGGEEESRLQLCDAAGGQGQAGTLWSVRWGTVEGKYWKQHIQAVTREYHKWRMYSCTQVRKMKDKPAALPSWGCLVPSRVWWPVASWRAAAPWSSTPCTTWKG
ncbi:carbohydrate-responsive element-binding protein-like isoform X3 [Buteo buteo]|uniref:carbohydrate-responsive element-binding protein-like isoform X3 n=1 Tax=Buteo buteo TaxID=30397 RepID=UPI003EBB7100